VEPLPVEFGKERIPVTITYTERRTLKINVLPERQVVVLAPSGR
jgi:hypothetical protein